MLGSENAKNVIGGRECMIALKASEVRNDFPCSRRYFSLDVHYVAVLIDLRNDSRLVEGKFVPWLCA